MATVTDTCDACGTENEWSVEVGGRRHCPECGATHHVWTPTETADLVGRVPARKRDTIEQLQPLDEIVEDE